jgi:hypothetical protein
MLLPLAGLGWWGFANFGGAGIVAALVAVLVCGLPAAAALVVSGLLTGTPQALNGLLGSILLRTFIPFALAVVLHLQVPYLAEAGVFGMTVVAYLVALVTETLLTLWLIGPTRSIAKAS